MYSVVECSQNELFIRVYSLILFCALILLQNNFKSIGRPLHTHRNIHIRYRDGGMAQFGLILQPCAGFDLAVIHTHIYCVCRMTRSQHPCNSANSMCVSLVYIHHHVLVYIHKSCDVNKKDRFSRCAFTTQILFWKHNKIFVVNHTHIACICERKPKMVWREFEDTHTQTHKNGRERINSQIQTYTNESKNDEIFFFTKSCKSKFYLCVCMWSWPKYFWFCLIFISILFSSNFDVNFGK